MWASYEATVSLVHDLLWRPGGNCMKGHGTEKRIYNGFY